LPRAGLESRVGHTGPREGGPPLFSAPTSVVRTTQLKPGGKRGAPPGMGRWAHPGRVGSFPAPYGDKFGGPGRMAKGRKGALRRRLGKGGYVLGAQGAAEWGGSEEAIFCRGSSPGRAFGGYGRGREFPVFPRFLTFVRTTGLLAILRGATEPRNLWALAGSFSAPPGPRPSQAIRTGAWVYGTKREKGEGIGDPRGQRPGGARGGRLARGAEPSAMKVSRFFGHGLGRF